MRLVASILSLVSLAAKRLWSRRWLMLCLLLGLVVAVGLLSSIPLYSDAAQNRLLQGKLQNAGTGTTTTELATSQEPFSFLWRYIGAWNGNVEWDDYLPVQQYLTEQVPGVHRPALQTLVRHVATDKLRLFPSEGAAFIPDEPLLWVSVGFITGLQDRIRLVEGSFPVSGQPGEPVEVLVSRTRPSCWACRSVRAIPSLLPLQAGRRSGADRRRVAGGRFQRCCLVLPARFL